MIEVLYEGRGRGGGGGGAPVRGTRGSALARGRRRIAANLRRLRGAARPAGGRR